MEECQQLHGARASAQGCERSLVVLAGLRERKVAIQKILKRLRDQHEHCVSIDQDVDAKSKTVVRAEEELMGPVEAFLGEIASAE
ncbi:hypothetical protein Ct61P_15136 [Colletotrichum tofieldiae]|nr:hypothetical protein Ct61P_15136 [Colletotrichum tofieldiae]